MTAYTEAYRGARFFKCDLQTQTPADGARWGGEAMEKTPEGMRRAAEAYIRRCGELDLNAIAVTDHNFASIDFLPYLFSARDAICPSLVIFPGFEIQANVGRGLHVLAVFDPSLDLGEIDHIMTECGIPPQRFVNGDPERSTKQLNEIIDVVQRKREGRLQGLVICPHSQADAGIFDNDRIAEWLQQAEFKNPKLLCLEVPRPPSDMSEGWQRLLEAGPRCDPAWRRSRPIACIMSSDAKALVPDDAPNHLGFRHTWIKMSEPSIEGLRQAFLDPGSRIRLCDENPDTTASHPWIRSIGVHGVKFLSDQELRLSQNLTTIIGGRGTGKSTIIEYLRLLLHQADNVFGDDSEANFRRINETVSNTSRLDASLVVEEEDFRLGQVGRDCSTLEGDPEGERDLNRFFPVQVLSQREIYAISGDHAQRRMLIDGVVAAELEQEHRIATDLTNRITELNAKLSRQPELIAQRRILASEKGLLELKINRLSEHEAQFAKWEELLLEEGALDENIGRSLQLVRLVLEATRNQDQLIEHADIDTANAEFLRGANEGIDQNRREFVAGIRNSARDHISRLRAMRQGTDWQEWAAEVEQERLRIDALVARLKAEGIEAGELVGFRKRLRELEREIAGIDEQLAGMTRLLYERDGYTDDDGNQVPGLITELHTQWEAESAVRTSAARDMEERMPLTEAGDPFVQIRVDPQSDRHAFAERMLKFVQDRRRFSDDDWAEFVDAACDAANRQNLPACEVVWEWTKELLNGVKPEGYPWGVGDRRSEVLNEWFDDDGVQRLRLWRTPDQVRVTLYRHDGTVVGEMDEEGGLSIGQRCTAVLALVLARETAPIIIDQPEEDLDNEFVFNELVPLLRKLKETRQIIVVTHNANIPVNADAECVIALEVAGGKGVIRERAGAKAIGGLDRVLVQESVQDIMEGSQQAFQQRLEKYGF